MSVSPLIPCPRCGVPASGNFCASCGTALGGSCAKCGAALAAGAKFCANCGASSGGGAGFNQQRMGASTHIARWTPWQIGTGLMVLAALALAWAFTHQGGASSSGGANAPAEAAPDISNLSPREQFGQLADRVETAMENGDSGTMVKFFPMAEEAFTNLTVADRDIDARFHISLLRSRVGQFTAGLAQADSIAAIMPTHLFAYYLRAIIGDLQHDTTAAKRARQAFRSHYTAEVATSRPEYQAHQQMLDQFFKSIPVK